MKAVFAYFQKQYQWSQPFTTDPDMLVRDLIQQGVEKAFTLAYTHKPGLSQQLNKWLHSFCLEYPLLEPFGAIHPHDPEPEKTAIECLDHYNFPGLKLHCLVQQCRPDDERLSPVYQAIAERSKGIIIHASNFPLPFKDYLGVTGIANLLRSFPGLNLVVPHLGLHDLREYSSLLEKYDGLFLDTSFVFQNSAFVPPLNEIEEIMLAYPDRFIYGSDYPFILEPPQNGIARVKELDLPEENFRKLFHENAAKFLNRVTGTL